MSCLSCFLVFLSELWNFVNTDGSGGGWKLPLPPLSVSDVEPYGPSIDQGEEAARHEAALKVEENHILQFLCMQRYKQGGCGNYFFYPQHSSSQSRQCSIPC